MEVNRSAAWDFQQSPAEVIRIEEAQVVVDVALCVESNPRTPVMPRLSADSARVAPFSRSGVP